MIRARFKANEEDYRPGETGVTATVTKSLIGGKILVFIDTDEEVCPCNNDGPTNLRVVINDDHDNPIWDN